MLLLYGANGYTGRLLVDECVARGVPAIVAGRRESALHAVAAESGYPARAFSLDDPRAIARGLDGVSTVLLAAGPFADTSAPILDACLAAGVHYLDITGELEVFEASQRRDAEGRERGIVILPGVGFDVVPTDCLAARLAERMPHARLLELAFAGGGSPSRGTRKTMARGAALGGAIRREGAIERVPIAWRRQTIAFRDLPRPCVTIPWGDVSTAYWSTHIPEIHVYVALPPAARTATSSRTGGHGRAWDDPDLDARLAGPGAEVRSSARMQLWGRVTDADGRTIEGDGETPEGYRLTALAAIESAVRVLARREGAGAIPPPGYHTPSTAFGAGFLEELPGCTLHVPSPRSP